MSGWDIDDAQMRDEVLATLLDFRAMQTRRANSAWATPEAAAHFRRQAAHFQQAIDLLVVAPMPTKD